MENHYEEEPVSKFSANVFETEEGIHRSSRPRTSPSHNHRQCKLLCSSGNNGQDVCNLPDDACEKSRCANGGQATLYISTGFKGTWTKVSITVCSQMGSLGISIAGGKGSTPYKINDEGIFISKVAKGGPADLAGLRVGDMVLEVNGISLQDVTHREAVNTLRNSGTVIKILILRNRAATTDTTVTSSSRTSESYTTHYDWSEHPNNEWLDTEGVFLEKSTCNGNNLGSVTSANRTVNSSRGTSQKCTSFCIVNHTMPDPLIEEKKAQCSVMKSVVRINQTAKPLAFTFVPTIRRLPAHIQIMDARFLHQPGKQQNPVSSSSVMNEFLFEPGSLRQQSEELYATIEQVLADPLPSTANATEKPNKELLQMKVTKRGSGRSVADYAGSAQETLEILEEEQEQAVK
ncbi:uncharacterized protein LOC127575150 [Pristis pectinata]|uniref:uncharacterized protein LOC127575150 n=1 Tax=Pristis pectinata TaxID=685728 RepID=UPI00223D5C6E|nr:uncharacterized protein LOC127575150 [Pristis pectinata]